MQTIIDIIRHLALHDTAVWLALTYIAVVLAMAVDFVAGVRKAHQAGVATTSRGFKMTTEKATKYFLPMLCLSCIDIITSVVLPAPFFTILMGGFNIFCEWKSVLESTHDKQELRTARQGAHLQRHRQEQGRHRRHRHAGHGTDGAQEAAGIQ